MALGKTAIKGGLAALMVMVMTAGAFAWDAYATTALNVRSGPGTHFRVVDVLQRGQVVDVEYCRSGWCFIQTGRYGHTGWASQNYLRQAGYQPPRPQPQPPHWGGGYPRPQPPHWGGYPRPQPPHWGGGYPRPQQPGYSSQVCFNGPNGYFCVGK